MYLLDTNIVSLIAPARRRGEAEAAVAQWVVARSDRLFLSVITAAEIEEGIARARREGATAKAGRLLEWWQEIVHYWHDRILPLDLDAARHTGLLLDRARQAGIAPGFEDAAIAAIAAANDLRVVTRNIRHFRPLGIDCLDPFTTLPA